MGEGERGECGDMREYECRLSSDFAGEGGAYISASCESSVGEVRAENMWRTLSHCVWVVCRHDERATRIREGEASPDEPRRWLLTYEIHVHSDDVAYLHTWPLRDPRM